MPDSWVFNILPLKEKPEIGSLPKPLRIHHTLHCNWWEADQYASTPSWGNWASTGQCESWVDSAELHAWLHVPFFLLESSYPTRIFFPPVYYKCGGFPCSSVGKESACNAGDPGSIPWLGRSPGEGNGNPLQYSCLENPMDRGTWRAIVHGVTRIGHNLATKPPPPL